MGAYLNVHEGPHGISGYVRSDKNKLECGMTVTDEPGTMRMVPEYVTRMFLSYHVNEARIGNKQFGF